MSAKTTDQTTAEDAPDAPAPAEETTEAPQEPEDTTSAEQTPEQSDEEQQEPEDDKPSREAQKLRKRLRETETERDAALEQVGQLRSTLIADAMTDARLTPEALWAAGHQPESFFTETGIIDHDALKAAVTETRSRFGIPLNGTPRPDPSQGIGGGNTRSPGAEWQEAFNVKH